MCGVCGDTDLSLEELRKHQSGSCAGRVATDNESRIVDLEGIVEELQEKVEALEQRIKSLEDAQGPVNSADLGPL